MSSAALRPVSSVATRWEDYSPWEIAEHLLATHHAFTWSELARLGALVEQLTPGQGPGAGQALVELFRSLRGDLEAHLRREESVLFPWIEELRIADAEGTAAPRAPFGAVHGPIDAIRSEHDAALGALRRMREASDPTHAESPLGRALDEGLVGLEHDLREHFRLEDEILGPMLLACERALVR